MTIGTATVASTNVRRTGFVSLSEGPMVRFRTVRVGKTAIQIISASWCFVGGPTAGTGRAVGVPTAFSDMVVLLGGRGVVRGAARAGPRCCAAVAAWRGACLGLPALDSGRGSPDGHPET